MISVIIPVYHEEERINATIRHIRNIEACSLDHAETEIIVIDGDPFGSTIRQVEDRDVICIVSPKKGRGPQMNHAALMAKGEILFFLHADTRIPESAFSDIRKTCLNMQHGAGAFDLGLDNPGKIYRIIERISSLRSRITRIPYGDQGIFIQKRLFSKMRGFSSFPIMEDVEFMLRLKKKKIPVHILSSRVITSARRWEKEGVILTTLRNWCLITLFFCGVSPFYLKRFYK